MVPMMADGGGKWWWLGPFKQVKLSIFKVFESSKLVYLTLFKHKLSSSTSPSQRTFLAFFFEKRLIILLSKTNKISHEYNFNV